jgi:hypothetical protein
MSHLHDHPQADPAPGSGPEPGPADKLRILLAHWVKHNDAHAQTYREWAQRAEEMSLGDVGGRLMEAVDLTLAINRTLEAALKAMASRE